MRTPLNRKYKTLIVYFNIYGSMPLQSKTYSPKLINKLFPPAILPCPKIRSKETHRIIYSSTPQSPPNYLTTNLAEKLFFEKRD